MAEASAVAFEAEEAAGASLAAVSFWLQAVSANKADKANALNLKVLFMIMSFPERSKKGIIAEFE